MRRESGSVRVLCLACSARSLSTLQAALKRSPAEFSILTATTSDQAVAVCIAHTVAAAVVDAEAIRGQEWTVVRTLKGVRAQLPIILLEDRKCERDSLPEGVDAAVSIDSPAELYETIASLVKKTRWS
jgi:DNA-binding response OmpR family regulator